MDVAWFSSRKSDAEPMSPLLLELSAMIHLLEIFPPYIPLSLNYYKFFDELSVPSLLFTQQMQFSKITSI
jgi:hypothetical protein